MILLDGFALLLATLQVLVLAVFKHRQLVVVELRVKVANNTADADTYKVVVEF